MIELLVKNKFAVFVAWTLLLLPILATAITSDIIFSPIIFMLLVIYLRKERRHIFLVSFLYGLLVYFSPYQYFIRWFGFFVAGDVPIREFLEQTYSLLKLRSTTYFNPPSAILAVLAIPAIYLINLRNGLKIK